MSSVMNRLLSIASRRYSSAALRSASSANGSRSFLAAPTNTTSRRNMADLAFTFASPQQVFYNKAKVRQVDVPTIGGDFGILPEHVPTIAALRPGLVVIYDNDGNAKKYFVSSGTVAVNPDSSVQMLAEEAFTLESFDANAAKDGLAKAQRDLSSATSEKAKAEAQITVEALEALTKALGAS